MFIEHPENIQLFHVQNMRDHLFGLIETPVYRIKVNSQQIFSQVLPNTI